MNLVCLDTHYFRWGILAKASPSQPEKIAQASEFFKQLEETDATILVATPVITELLMGATPEESIAIIREIEANFRVAEFDQLTAKVAADIWKAKKGRPEIEAILKSETSLRTKMKVDVMILATAITTQASLLYTEDEDFRKLAEGYIPTRRMPVALQPDLPGFESPNAKQGTIEEAKSQNSPLQVETLPLEVAPQAEPERSPVSIDAEKQ